MDKTCEHGYLHCKRCDDAATERAERVREHYSEHLRYAPKPERSLPAMVKMPKLAATLREAYCKHIRESGYDSELQRRAAANRAPTTCTVVVMRTHDVDDWRGREIGCEVCAHPRDVNYARPYDMYARGVAKAPVIGRLVAVDYDNYTVQVALND